MIAIRMNYWIGKTFTLLALKPHLTAALCGLAWAIVNAMFTAGGQGANIQLQEPS